MDVLEQRLRNALADLGVTHAGDADPTRWPAEQLAKLLADALHNYCQHCGDRTDGAMCHCTNED